MHLTREPRNALCLEIGLHRLEGGRHGLHGVDRHSRRPAVIAELSVTQYIQRYPDLCEVGSRLVGGETAAVAISLVAENHHDRSLSRASRSYQTGGSHRIGNPRFSGQLDRSEVEEHRQPIHPALAESVGSLEILVGQYEPQLVGIDKCALCLFPRTFRPCIRSLRPLLDDSVEGFCGARGRRHHSF